MEEPQKKRYKIINKPKNKKVHDVSPPIPDVSPSIPDVSPSIPDVSPSIPDVSPILISDLIPSVSDCIPIQGLTADAIQSAYPSPSASSVAEAFYLFYAIHNPKLECMVGANRDADFAAELQKMKAAGQCSMAVYLLVKHAERGGPITTIFPGTRVGSDEFLIRSIRKKRLLNIAAVVAQAPDCIARTYRCIVQAAMDGRLHCTIPHGNIDDLMHYVFHALPYENKLHVLMALICVL